MKSKAKKQKPIGTIGEEAAACRKAFAKSKVGDPVLHCHHAQGIEILTERAAARITFILLNKHLHEQARRLRYFRPIKKALLPKKWQKAYAERQKAYAEWQKADAEWRKADAEWRKAYAEWQKADAEWRKADAEWQKADAEWRKAYAEWQKTRAFKEFHAAVCGCPFSDTKDIFGNLR